MFEPVFVISLGIIFPSVSSPALCTLQGRNRCHFGYFEHAAKLPGFQLVGVKDVARVIHSSLEIALSKLLDFLDRLGHAIFRPEDAHMIEHDVLHFLANSGDFLGAFTSLKILELLANQPFGI